MVLFGWNLPSLLLLLLGGSFQRFEVLHKCLVSLAFHRELLDRGCVLALLLHQTHQLTVQSVPFRSLVVTFLLQLRFRGPNTFHNRFKLLHELFARVWRLHGIGVIIVDRVQQRQFLLQIQLRVVQRVVQCVELFRFTMLCTNCERRMEPFKQWIDK